MISFNELSDDAKVWIYIADRQLNVQEVEELKGKIESFLPRWRSEGKEFKSAYELKENQILVVGGETEGFAFSGCTMDALKKTVEKWDEALKVNFVAVPKFCYRTTKGIECKNQAGFKADVVAGKLDENAIVFDNTIQNMGVYRKGIEFKVTECWHNRIFKQAVAIAK